MKVDARRMSAFLRDPGSTRLVLLHGDDEGLVRQRADALTVVVAGSKDDAFRVAWLGREDHARLAEEASAISMLGGRRVIRVREAGDGLAAAVTALVKDFAASGGDSVVVLEGGAMPARSKLRALVEALPEAAAIACYPEEGRALGERIAASLAAAGIGVEADALQFAVERMGNDSAAVGGEIEKLILYAGDERRLRLDDVRACVGDAGAVAFDDAVFAATSGDAAAVDRALERALAEGAAPVAVARGVLGHLAKLHLARGRMADGASADDATRSVRPPVFFKRVPEFTRALRHWDAAKLMQAMRETRRVELACKQTGSPDVLLVRRLIAALVRQGRTGR